MSTSPSPRPSTPYFVPMASALSHARRCGAARSAATHAPQRACTAGPAEALPWPRHAPATLGELAAELRDVRRGLPHTDFRASSQDAVNQVEMVIPEAMGRLRRRLIEPRVRQISVSRRTLRIERHKAGPLYASKPKRTTPSAANAPKLVQPCVYVQERRLDTESTAKRASGCPRVGGEAGRSRCKKRLRLDPEWLWGSLLGSRQTHPDQGTARTNLTYPRIPRAP